MAAERRPSEARHEAAAREPEEEATDGDCPDGRAEPEEPVELGGAPLDDDAVGAPEDDEPPAVDPVGAVAVGAEVGALAGVVADGLVTLGVETFGVVTCGVVTDGTVTPGVVPTGVVAEGTVTEGTVTEGTVTEGTVTDGTVTWGVVMPGTLTFGVVTLGSPSLGSVAALPASGSTMRTAAAAASPAITHILRMTPETIAASGTCTFSPGHRGSRRELTLDLTLSHVNSRSRAALRPHAPTRTGSLAVPGNPLATNIRR